MMTPADDDAPFTIESPADVFKSDRERAILALRLGLAVNPLRSSQRHFVAVSEARGPGGERDSVG